MRGLTRRLLRTRVYADRIREPHRSRHLREEAHAFLERIHQRHADVRRRDREGNARQPRARPYVNERLCPIEQRGIVRRQAVDDMLHRHILG